ncbi:MAG: choice-of-anchor A family protein, partial [Clostridia bacterium]|nr:choice-of-anchor A family protein [Clostridia bacterium]
MKRGSLKIINSLTSISLCILLVFTSLPLKVMKRQNVNADMSMASAVSLLDDYTLIVFGDHSVKNEHIKGPWAVEGDITFNGKVSMSKNNDNSYFLPRTYDFVLGGKAIYETDSYGLGLTNDDEEYLIASVNEANLRVVELANGTTYNEATINTFGTEENPLPFNFDDAKKAFQAWNSDVYDFCTTEDNPKVIDIDISDRTYGDIEINAGSGTTYVNLKLSDESYANYDNIKIRVPSKNDNVVINMESGIFNIGKAMLAIGDGEFVNVGHGENATNINQTSEEDVERTIWFNEHVIYNYAGKDEIKVNLPLGSLIAPNASIVVKGNYFNGSWVVKNIRGEYGEIHAYSVGLAYTGWADSIPSHTPNLSEDITVEDVVVTVKDDKGNPVKGVEVTLTDSNSDEHVLTTGDDGKVTFKDIPQGDYTVEETKVPDNYEDANPSKKTGNVDGDKSTPETESFTNNKTPDPIVTEDVVVTVKDDKGNPVKGV